VDNDRIKYIFKKDLGLEIDSIIDSSKGVDHKVYIVSYKNKKYIFRESVKNKNTLYNINFALNKLNSKKVPKILIYNKNYLIETYIFGEELDKFNKNKLSVSEFKYIYFKF
jgi:predicted Ser/Thr protein kinase